MTSQGYKTPIGNPLEKETNPMTFTNIQTRTIVSLHLALSLGVAIVGVVATSF